MQNLKFHTVRKQDAPQPNKYPKMNIFCPKYAPKSTPKLPLIPAIDFVTFWDTIWLRLGSHLAPGWAQDEPIWPPKALPAAPKDPKGLPWGAPGGPKGPPRATQGSPKGSPRPFRDHLGDKFATFAP